MQYSQRGFDLTFREHKLREPLSWRSPRRVFVNSMSDLFHKDVPVSFLDSVFETMEAADWHVFQVLTKRSSLMRRYVNQRYPQGMAPKNIWLGVSIEDKRALTRLTHLKQAHATIRFVSFEPLLEDLGDLDLSGIHWAIAGGESGPGARPIQAEWVHRVATSSMVADGFSTRRSQLLDLRSRCIERLQPGCNVWIAANSNPTQGVNRLRSSTTCWRAT